MPREARTVVPGAPHHVIQRGNRNQDVFFRPQDRSLYLEILADSADDYGVSFLSYCLMTNHVHLIAVPSDETSFAGCFRNTHMRYSRHVNSRFGWSGHLWQYRYGSNPMDHVYLYHVLRYVERNPVRAGVVDDPWDYPWSSAAFRVSKRAFDPLVEEDVYLEQIIGGDWREYLQGKTAAEILEELNSAARSNRVLGTPAALTSASNPRA